MTLAIIAGVLFLAHVAVWLGLPTNRVTQSMSESPAPDMILETA